MDRRERESIMRQGATRPETPRDRRERAALEEDLRDNPVAGRPLRRRLRNFRPDASAQLTAVGGPLAWMRRLRNIELALERHEARLREAREELIAGANGDPGRFAREWRELVDSWDFGDVNALIESHNRNYPAESLLPMNPRTGDFVLVNGRPYTRNPIGRAWIVERFPDG
jgi:hypothetical protein